MCCWFRVVSRAEKRREQAQLVILGPSRAEGGQPLRELHGVDGASGVSSANISLLPRYAWGIGVLGAICLGAALGTVTHACAELTEINSLALSNLDGYTGVQSNWNSSCYDFMLLLGRAK